ncbi:MAG: hypothetical protein AAF593_04980 [Planctomycetota bacterium]
MLFLAPEGLQPTNQLVIEIYATLAQSKDNRESLVFAGEIVASSQIPTELMTQPFRRIRVSIYDTLSNERIDRVFEIPTDATDSDVLLVQVYSPASHAVLGTEKSIDSIDIQVVDSDYQVF